MPAPPQPILPDEAASEAFYARALPRIRGFMLGLAIPVAVFVLLRFGWKIGVGFVVGCAIAYVNFYWLKRTVNGLADQLTTELNGQAPPGFAAVQPLFEFRKDSKMFAGVSTAGRIVEQVADPLFE